MTATASKPEPGELWNEGYNLGYQAGINDAVKMMTIMANKTEGNVENPDFQADAKVDKMMNVIENATSLGIC